MFITRKPPETWRKSSHSVQNGSCIELSNTLDGVRDSKNPTGAALSGDLDALLTAVKQGQITG